MSTAAAAPKARAMALDPSMAAAPVLAGASAPVEVPPRLRSSVLEAVGLVVDEVRVRVAEVKVPLVLLREVGSPVP